VTGAKFTEENPSEGKKQSSGGGHSVPGAVAESVSEETKAKREKIRVHQEACARISWAEVAQTIVAQKEAFAVLATNSKSMAGFPLASLVGFAVDKDGRPIFCFSTMSAHTVNLMSDGRASLCVTEKGFVGAADARVTLVGTVKKVEGEEAEELRSAYMASHAGAYWAQFGDFSMYRMEDIKQVSFVGGFARAGSVTPEEYLAAKPDPLHLFAQPVMKHMNDDHTDALKDYVRYLVGVEGPIDKVEMRRLDRLGFDMRVTNGNDSGLLRIPFENEVRERKDVKTAIVALSQKVAAQKAKEEEEGKKEE